MRKALGGKNTPSVKRDGIPHLNLGKLRNQTEMGGKISSASVDKKPKEMGRKIEGGGAGVAVPYLNLEPLRNLDLASDELSDASTLDGKPNVSFLDLHADLGSEWRVSSV